MLSGYETINLFCCSLPWDPPTSIFPPLHLSISLCVHKEQDVAPW